MKRFLLFSIGALMIAGPSGAVEVQDCSDVNLDSADIAQPIEANVRPFANGNVRLMVVDTKQSAEGAFHLLVFSPPYDALGKGGCQSISYEPGVGFKAMTLKDMSAQYDPKVGLLLEMPVTAGSGAMSDGRLSLTLNQATGLIVPKIIFD